MSAAAVVTGLGSVLPARVVSNAELAPCLDVTEEWIERRTGIRARHAVEPGVTTSDLAVAAGRNALESAGEPAADAVVVATTTPDRLSPATAPGVAYRLGLGPAVTAFDLAAVCSGFVYGLAVSAGLISCGVADRVLLIGAETMSYFLHRAPATRGSAVLFGDGAGAVLLQRGAASDQGALEAFDLGSDGAGTDLITIAAGGSRQRAQALAADRPLTYAPEADLCWALSGQEVYRRAIVHMRRSAEAVLARTGHRIDDVDRFVAHQANQRILDATATQLGIPAARRLGNVATVGNTGAASIPLALADACQDGDLVTGHRLLITAFGGGLTWGSTLLTWPEIKAVSTTL
jgi:3-oxoacyl-[acyl-carrier-protein] synthase-3